MTRTLTLAAALIAAFPALADERGLTVAEALSLLSGLRALDGRVVVVKDDKVLVPWEFGSGALRVKIARDISALAPVERRVEEARFAIVREITAGLPPGKSIEQGTPAYDKFQLQLQQVLDAPAGKLDLARIRESELKLDRNEIPVTALSALVPIMDGDGR